MSGAPTHWDDKPIPWDALYISGHVAPGMVDDINVDRGYKVDEKTGNGIDGATATIQGREVARVNIKLKMWTRRHLNLVDALVYSIYTKPRLTKQVKPFDFSHPLLEMHGLRALIVENTSGPTKPDHDGFSYLSLACKEFTPQPAKPVSATTTPKATTSAALPTWTAEDESLLKTLEAQRTAAYMNGVDTSKIDERIWNLKQRKTKLTSTAVGDSAPTGPGAGAVKP